jgi:hypothetical protein
MNHAITMGIFWHLIGAASAACFYAPFKKLNIGPGKPCGLSAGLSPG